MTQCSSPHRVTFYHCRGRRCNERRRQCHVLMCIICEAGGGRPKDQTQSLGPLIPQALDFYPWQIAMILPEILFGKVNQVSKLVGIVERDAPAGTCFHRKQVDNKRMKPARRMSKAEGKKDASIQDGSRDPIARCSRSTRTARLSRPPQLVGDRRLSIEEMKQLVIERPWEERTNPRQSRGRRASNKLTINHHGHCYLYAVARCAR